MSGKQQSAQEKLAAARRVADEARAAYEMSGYSEEEGRAWTRAKERAEALSLLAPRKARSR